MKEQKARGIVIGFREEPRPKGHGYLFWRLEEDKNETWVCDCDLFDISPEVVRRMLGKALNQIIVKLGLARHELKRLEMRFENMSPLAVDLLNQEMHKISMESGVGVLARCASVFDSGSNST